MKLSIVTTLYCSEKYIFEFYQRATTVAQQFAQNDYEIIIVDDGSPDTSLSQAVELSKNDAHVKVIELSRNFGHHKALRSGLENAKGDFIFLIDSDLEEEPEWLMSFYQQLIDENDDVVYGVQAKRKGNIFERISGDLYYRLLNFFLNIQHPKNMTTARLMKKKYVESLLKYTETETAISCLWVIAGFKQSQQEVRKHNHSPSTYGFFKKISLALNVIFSFSTVPLTLIFFIGNMITIFSFIYIIKLIFEKMFLYKIVDGWTSIIVSIWFLGGLVISFLGILGIYLSNIFKEVKHRPNAIIREIYTKDSQCD